MKVESAKRNEREYDWHKRTNSNAKELSENMNWLNRLDELATRMLPEEDRNHQQEGDIMTIDPLLDMDVGISYNASNDEENDDDESYQDDLDTTQHPVDATNDVTDDANKEFDEFVAGSSSLVDRAETGSIIEPIALECSILDDSNSASQLSEQPTGDVTTEKRPQLDEGKTTFTPTQARNVDLAGDELDNFSSASLSSSYTNPPRDVMQANQCDEAERVVRTHDIVPPPSGIRKLNQRDEGQRVVRIREVASAPDETERTKIAEVQQGTHSEDVVHPPRAAQEIKKMQDVSLELHTTPKRKPFHPLFMTPEARIQGTATPSFKTPSSEATKDEMSFESDEISYSPLPPTNIDVTSENNRDTTEFEVNQPIQDWNSTPVPFESTMNCLGVVHVRALAAQRLPCPVGSTVQLAVSLAPWKGKVKGETTVSFGGDDVKNSGVCVKWDALNEGSGCSMVHSWNSEDTPIPVIKMDLLFKPIKMLEFKMCALELSCQPLMTQPGLWKKQWCQATPSPSLQQKGSTACPLVLIEAAFFPAGSQEEEEDLDHYDENALEDSTTGEQSTRFDDGSTAIGSYLLKSRNKPHLLKLQSFWMPAQCSVCDRSLVGRKMAFRCEACNIDCCGDCQLQIDLQIPCGSNVAENAIKRSIQHKLSLKHVLTTLAPVDEDYEHKLSQKVQEIKSDSSSSAAVHVDDKSLVPEKQGIGIFSVQVYSACVFDISLPMETEPMTVFDHASLKQGDYYVRITCKTDQSSRRTKTIQNTGKPNFDAPKMDFSIPHYGMEYRIDVIDAYSNKAVGTTLLTTQSILQLQRDRHVKQRGISAFLPGSRFTDDYAKPMTLNLELRTGFKDGFGSDYFAPNKKPNSGRNSLKPGSISGWIALDVCVVEDIDRLYGPSPIQCPPRPPSNLDMELLQLHIARISTIIADIKRVSTWYIYMVSWKNPILTFVSLLVFLHLCLTFDVEYIGSLPILLLLVGMVCLAFLRKTGHLKDRFVQRERDKRMNLELESFVDRSLHRPLGAIQISIRKGRHLKSRELGLPGSVGCHVLWHPLRYCQNDEKSKELSSTDKVLKAHHDIGDTNYLFTTNPDWETMKESEDLTRLQQLVPIQRAENETFLEHADTERLEFPVLQPIRRHAIKQDETDDVRNNAFASVAQWSDTVGAIVVQVKFADVINMLPGFENILGEVVIPVSKLIRKGEYEGWFQVVEVGATHYVRCAEDSASEAPRIYIQLRWRQPTHAEEIPDTEREASIVVAEEMMRAAAKNSRNKLDIIGSSIGALNTVRGIGGTVQTIQNTLGSVVDVLETIRNLFNFTDPQISCFVFFALFALWAFLAIIPTRAIVFACGMLQYVATLSTHLTGLKSAQSNKEKIQTTDLTAQKNKQTSPSVVSWVLNALSSVPTDEDLRKVYFWESSRIGERESSKRATEKRVFRLEQLWNAKWFSLVQLKVANERRTSVSGREWHWESRFVVVHGRRLLIWGSDKDFDEGAPPVDRVFLGGHAGLAGLSPLEIRELTSAEIPRVANIFGRGASGQLKLMVLVPDQSIKEALEDVVVSASLKDD